MLFNKIKISLSIIFFFLFVCSLSYNLYQRERICSLNTEINTLRTTLSNVKQINEKNFILDKKYNNLLNTINKGDANDSVNIIKDFNSISNSLSKLYDTRVQQY